nr:phospholipase domain-containing protein [Sphingomonas sp. H160509]
MPHQESGRRPARALPYNLAVDGARNAAQGFDLRITNTGKAGAGFNVYAPDDHQGPWFYTVEAGKSLTDTLPLPASGEYWYRVHGPNGFLREFKGSTGTHMAQPRIEARFARRDDKFEISVIAAAFSGCDVTIEHLDYLNESVRLIALQPGQRKTSRIDLKPSDHWYDIIVRIGGSPTTVRLAGHAETGRSSVSDPAYGRRAT